MKQPAKISVQWGHLALLAVIAGLVLFYLLDARSVSSSINNLILVQPAAIIALILVLVVLPQCFRRPEEADPEGTLPPKRETGTELAKIGVLTGAFIALAFLMERIGFDIATFVFLVVAIYICGERNWFANLAFSAAFTMVLIFGYGAIIPFPFPLTIL